MMANSSTVIFFNMLRWLKRVAVYMVIILVTLVVVFEFYNPYGDIERAGLPKSTIQFHNQMFDDLPKEISVRFNNIGWLGQDYNDSVQGKRVFFIGSSTTQNIFITGIDNRWTDVAMAGVPYWYNNAALKGTAAGEWKKVVASLATYHPSHIVLMVTPFEPSDLHLTFFNSSGAIKQRILKLAFLKYVVSPYYITIRPANFEWGHKIEWTELKLDTLQKKQFDSVAAAESVLAIAQVVDKIKEIGAVPILISQPTAYGNYYYQRVPVDQMIGSHYEQAIHDYFARKVKAICYAKGGYYIDGFSFPRSFDYYLDNVHFNKEGNKRFGAFVRDSLQKFLKLPIP